MTRFEAILNYLYYRLPMFQRTGPAAYKHSLDTTLKLDALYDHPHRHYPTVHVAGTNGKGSVSHMLASVLQSAGYRTGLYTSPHLKDFRERIRINGKMISKSDVTAWVAGFRKKDKELQLQPSFFELTAALAFDYFARRKVDIAVIETGLGGRLDSTNIITPVVSVITNISFDHMSLLGNTLEAIALEKAGIIKQKIPVVISQFQPELVHVFKNIAKYKDAPLWYADREFTSGYRLMDVEGKQVFNFLQNGVLRFPDLKVDLPGLYQRLNIPAVLKTMDILKTAGWKIPDSSLYKGLASVTTQTGLMGRWQITGYNPLIICDTGHNEDGIRQVVEQLEQTPFKKLHIVFGIVADKDAGKILSLLPKHARYYFTKADIPRALDEELLQAQASDFGLSGESFHSVAKAFDAAREAAAPEDLIFVGGSNFVVAEVL